MAQTRKRPCSICAEPTSAKQQDERTAVEPLSLHKCKRQQCICNSQTSTSKWIQSQGSRGISSTKYVHTCTHSRSTVFSSLRVGCRRFSTKNSIITGCQRPYELVSVLVNPASRLP